jgi:HEPN domain-containing protein
MGLPGCVYCTPNLTAAQKLGLDEVISVITKKVLPVESITLLGTHPDPFTFYLVILLNDHDKLVEHEIANRIEDICRSLVSIITIVHKGNSARSSISMGNRFWNHTFSKGLNVYAAPGFELPEYQMLEADVYKDKVTTDWERWGGQGKAFLKGAHYYLGIENYTLALFSLHQAAESTLIGTIKCVLGYRFSVHNLLRMFRITQLFTDELKNVLEMDRPENLQLFNLLQVAYSETRYRGSFIANESAVRQLVPIVESLLATAQAVYEKFVEENH